MRRRSRCVAGDEGDRQIRTRYEQIFSWSSSQKSSESPSPATRSCSLAILVGPVVEVGPVEPAHAAAPNPAFACPPLRRTLRLQVDVGQAPRIIDIKEGGYEPPNRADDLTSDVDVRGPEHGAGLSALSRAERDD